MLSTNNDKLIQANHLKEQKQIEDMAADLHEELETENIPYHECYFMAQRLIKKGWIKPNEDSVVFSREEYEEYQKFKSFLERNDWESVEHIETTLDKCQEVLYERLKQSNKEMAEKIYNFVDKFLRYDEENLIPNLANYLKQFGVEINNSNSFNINEFNKGYAQGIKDLKNSKRR